MDMSGRKALPIGNDNFANIVSNNGYYVDKTHFVGKLLDSVVPGGALLFTRPRRFGKSLALSMLRRFFDCNEKEKNRPLFDGLAVAQSERYMAEQGKYPVIFLNLKNVKESTQALIEEALKGEIRRSIDPFAYLLRSDKLEPFEKDRLRYLLSSDASMVSLSQGLLSVCSWLFRHHGQPVVILIDEYDTPLQVAHLNGFYEPICNIIRNLFGSALKSNDYLRLGVVTGVMRIAKDSLFSGLNNLKVDTILSDKYADCFGFTQAEVDSMADYYGAPDKGREIREWYDGYRFGEQDIYNPWSVLKYFKTGCEPQAYWLDTSSNDLVISALYSLTDSQQDEVKALYEGGHVDATLDTSVTFPQLQSQNPNILYSLMTMSGYLKPIERVLDGLYRLVIPNKEIKKIYASEIVGHLQDNINFSKLTHLRSAIVHGEEQNITALLNEYMLASLSYFDTTEKFYHGLMLGLFFALSEEYFCKSNREAGEGRSDAMLLPRPGCNVPGVVFEFKHSKTVKALPEKADEALRQIEDRQYIADFPSEVKEVLGYGISFCRKRCLIKQKTWRR